jgi:predicted ATPase
MWQQEGGLPRQHLFEALSEFGTKSSLFRKVGVRRLGKSPSDPFQIVVTTAGPPVNLPDVGYGVSQALPVIIQSVLASEHRMLLLQQPEVHLHPRGQAALGSFFCRLVAREHKHFVIETHSDYLLDRVRIEVGQGTVPPENVLILFFDKKGLATQIHPINLDKLGNVIGAPDSYRRFFLDEEINLVTRSGS